VGRRLEGCERRGRNAAERKRLLGGAVVRRERKSEQIGAGVGDAQVLADRRDQRLATLGAEPFRHVEHQVRAGQRELLWEELIGFEADDAAEETESLLHRGDGGGIVPLGVRVVATVGVFGRRELRFFVVCETDAHVVSGYLLQKRPRVVRSGKRKRVVEYDNVEYDNKESRSDAQ